MRHQNVQIAARSGVMNDIPDGETWGGYPAKEFRKAAQEVIAVKFLVENFRKVKRFLSNAGGDES